MGSNGDLLKKESWQTEIKSSMIDRHVAVLLALFGFRHAAAQIVAELKAEQQQLFIDLQKPPTKKFISLKRKCKKK